MESVEFYARLLYQAKMLGGPKELSQSQVERLYEIRRQFGLKGKHPADVCVGKKCNGGMSCHTCGGHSQEKTDEVSADMIADITKKVMEQLGLK